jgi:hypothetical protein
MIITNLYSAFSLSVPKLTAKPGIGQDPEPVPLRPVFAVAVEVSGPVFNEVLFLVQHLYFSILCYNVVRLPPTLLSVI